MATPNEQLAAGVGQDSPAKEPIDKLPKYAPAHEQGAPIMPDQPASTVNPFGSLKGGK